MEKLGLGQYAQRFAENDISFVILPDLTDQDFEKIGVASLGHRRLLLHAIADLNRIEKSPPPARLGNCGAARPTLRVGADPDHGGVTNGLCRSRRCR